MVGDDVQKVACRICHTEHPYRHNQNPKKELTKEAAFDKLLDAAKTQLEGSPAKPVPAKAKRTR